MNEGRYCVAIVGGRGAIHARAAGARRRLLGSCEAGVELVQVVGRIAVLASF